MPNSVNVPFNNASTHCCSNRVNSPKYESMCDRHAARDCALNPIVGDNATDDCSGGVAATTTTFGAVRRVERRLAIDDDATTELWSLLGALSLPLTTPRRFVDRLSAIVVLMLLLLVLLLRTGDVDDLR